MELTDIAGIVFVCVAMNHLGLISAVEDAIRQKLWILDCPKCATFWGVLAYGSYHIATSDTTALEVLAISFLCAWLAVWMELGMGAVDQLYMYCYEKIFKRTANGTASADAIGDNTADAVSDVQIS